MTDDNIAPDDGAVEGSFGGEATVEAVETPPVVDAPDEGNRDEADDPNPEVNDKTDDDAGEDDKHRSKPAHKRIAEITKARRDAERERDELRAENERLKGHGQPAVTPKAISDVLKELEARKPDPNDPKYDFGENDPLFQDEMADWRVDYKLAKRDEAAAEKQAKEDLTKRQAAIEEVAANLNSAWEAKAAAAVEKYPDFNEKVLETAAAGEWDCGPLVSIALADSEQGADIAYHLASNPKEAKELSALALTDPMEAARRFGRLEARFEAKSAANDTEAAKRRVTNAPEPPKHSARGSSGQFTTSPDTDDLDAFERDHGKALGVRR